MRVIKLVISAMGDQWKPLRKRQCMAAEAVIKIKLTSNWWAWSSIRNMNLTSSVKKKLWSMNVSMYVLKIKLVIWRKLCSIENIKVNEHNRLRSTEIKWRHAHSRYRAIMAAKPASGLWRKRRPPSRILLPEISQIMAAHRSPSSIAWRPKMAMHINERQRKHSMSFRSWRNQKIKPEMRQCRNNSHEKRIIGHCSKENVMRLA